MIFATIGDVLYLVDFNGNIEKKKGKGFQKAFPDKDGYLKYALQQNGKTFNISVHKLVWELHNGEVPKGMTVDHIDGNKLNNNIRNLQLLSAKDNAIKGNARKWIVTNPHGIAFEVYNLSQFCRDNGLHAGHMHEVARGYKNQSHCKGWKCNVYS